MMSASTQKPKRKTNKMPNEQPPAAVDLDEVERAAEREERLRGVMIGIYRSGLIGIRANKDFHKEQPAAFNLWHAAGIVLREVYAGDPRLEEWLNLEAAL
jgi:hypothetical protein